MCFCRRILILLMLMKSLISYPVQGIGLDFVHDKGRNLEQLKTHGFPTDKVLAAGVIDGRNIWKADLEERLDAVLDILSIAKVDELWIQPSSSLLHVPVAKHPDEHLEKDLLNGLSYAKEKLAEPDSFERRLSIRKSGDQRRDSAG